MKQEVFKDKIIEMYKKNRNGGIVAKELGITTYRVYKCLRKAGFDIKPRGPEKYSINKIKGMYERGMSTNKIADKLGMCPSSVWERLKRRGLVRDRTTAHEMGDKRVRIKQSDHDKVIQMYHDGMSSMQIANFFGLSCKDTVLKILHDNDIEVRDMYGDNNPSWKGGVTPLHNLIRNCEYYIKFRERIMKERNYTCEISNQRGIKLNMHHKIPFAKLLNDFIDKYGTDISNRDLFYKRVKSFKPFWNKCNILLVAEEIHKRIHSDF